MIPSGAAKQPRVGFIGLGDIGRPMAQRLIKAGFPVTLWARREASLAPFRDAAHTQAADPARLAHDSDVVGVCVFDEAGLHEVVLGERGVLSGMSAGGVILVHSTVSVHSLADLHQQCAARGVTMLDAPVIGAPARAASGQLTVLVGGPGEVFESVRPVLAAFGSRIVHVGPVGSGLKLKLVNQALLLANVNAAALALNAAARMGLDVTTAIALLRQESGASYGLDMLADRLLPAQDAAVAGIRIADKDLQAFQATGPTGDLSTLKLGGFAQEAKESLARLRAETRVG